MARDMAAKNEDDNQGRSAEFVLYDMQDAFCHFPVCRTELANCLAPSQGRQAGGTRDGNTVQDTRMCCQVSKGNRLLQSGQGSSQSMSVSEASTFSR